MSAEETANIARLLECPICLDRLKDPRILPCLHSLCFVCLQKYVAQSPSVDGARDDTLICPACRNECPIPGEGIQDFPKNFFVNSLEDYFKKAGRPTDDHQDFSGASGVSGSSTLPQGAAGDVGACQNSKKPGKHDDVAVFCKECNLYICQNCADSHSFFSTTQNHTFTPAHISKHSNLDEDIGQKRRQKCETHEDQIRNFLCETCDVTVCPMCCLLTHKNHQYVELKAKTPAENHSSLEKMKAEVFQYIAELNRVAKDLDQARGAMKKDVEAMRGELQNLGTELGGSLSDKLSSCEKDAMLVINSAVKENEIQKANALSLQSYIKTFQQPDESGQLYLSSCVHGLLKQLQSQRALPLHLVKWTLLRLPSETKAAAAATISLSSSSSSSGLEGSGSIQLGKPVQTISLTCPNIAPAFVVTRGVILVIHRGDPKLWIYSADGTFIKASEVSGLQYAAGMAQMQSSDIKVLITDINGALYIVKLSPKYTIRSQVTKNVSFVPRRVCVDPQSGELIVAGNGAKEIVNLDTDGQIKKRIPVDKRRIWSLCCAAKDGDEYMVADSGNNIVAWTDSSGSITHIYGTRWGGELHHPCHLVKDGQGRTLVVEHMNDAVQLLGADKTFLQNLLTRRDGIQRPTSVHVDNESGLLYVANGPEKAQRITVYNYPKSTGFASCNVTHLTLTVRL